MVMVPIYMFIWLVSNWFSGAYDKPQKLFASIKGITWGTLIILSIYALLPLNYRFSRAIIILGAIWTMASTLGIRLLISFMVEDLFPTLQKKKRNAIVGLQSDAERVIEILKSSNVDFQYIGLVSPQSNITDQSQLANIDQLEEFVRVNNVNEVIFCSSNISSQEIIKNMLILSSHGVEYKIAPPESVSIIGSNSINTLGELYTPDFKAISTPVSRRNKRIFDVGMSISILATLPIWIIINKNRFLLLKSLILVLIGKRTWIGYIPCIGEPTRLPEIRKGVFTLSNSKFNNVDRLSNINLIYAKSYSTKIDFAILWRGLIYSLPIQ